MSARDDFQDMATNIANELLATAVFGVAFILKPRGGSNVNLIGDVEEERKEAIDVGGSYAERTVRRFYAPVQTSFPPTDGISIDDEIYYPTTESDYCYRVTAAEDAGLGHGYWIETERVQQRRVGG